LHAQVYAFHGYTPKTIAQLLECCNADLPTILLVGTGFPRQEAFLAESQKEIHAAGILAFAVGGLIDRFAGKEHR
jgi:UDP-N-acetyl-D-mannosaminuronic acid transferase (WecB/TagA/CpsF family)